MPRKLEDRMPKRGSERKRKPGAGRPTLLTEETRDAVVSALKDGCYHETAAGVAGVHISTLRDWLRRGARERKRLVKDPDAKPLASEAAYAQFSAACEKAQAECERDDLKTIGTASKTQWQAAAWRLERKYPERYGRRDKHEVTGEGGGPIRVAAEMIFVTPEDDTDKD